MGSLSTRAKRPHRIAIPADLRIFLLDVSRRIEAGDAATRTPSDDRLHCDFCYGGLVDASRREYAFTYFPEDFGTTEWTLKLSAAAVTSIADGRTRTLDLWRCDESGCAHLFAAQDDVCLACDCTSSVAPLRPTQRYDMSRFSDSLLPP